MSAAERRTAAPAPALNFGGTPGAPALPVLPPRSTTPPPPPAAPAAAPAPAAVPAPRERRAPAPAATPAPRRGGRRRRKSDGPPDETGVWLPLSLRKRLRAYRQTNDGTTYTDIVLDAIETHHDELPALVAASAPDGARSGSLFAGRAARRRQHDEDQVQATIRPGSADMAAIDALVESCGAANRSHLVSAALDRYLPALPDDDQAGQG